MANILVRGTVTKNKYWDLQPGQEDFKYGSVLVRMSSVYQKKTWHNASYSKDTEYREVIPMLELRYHIDSYSLVEDLVSQQRVEITLDKSALEIKESHHIEVKGDTKILYVKVWANNLTVPLVQDIKGTGLPEKDRKVAVSSQEIISLLVPSLPTRKTSVILSAEDLVTKTLVEV